MSFMGRVWSGVCLVNVLLLREEDQGEGFRFFDEFFDLGLSENLEQAFQRPDEVMRLVAKRLRRAYPGPAVTLVCQADGTRYELPSTELHARLPWFAASSSFRDRAAGSSSSSSGSSGRGGGGKPVVVLPECASHSLALLLLVEDLWGGRRLVASGDLELARYALHISSFFDLASLGGAAKERISSLGTTTTTFADVPGSAAAVLADGALLSSEGVRSVAVKWYIDHPEQLDGDTAEGKVDAASAAEIHALRKASQAPASAQWPAVPAGRAFTSYRELFSVCDESLDETERRLQKSRAQREARGLGRDDLANGGAALAEAELDVAQRRAWVAGHRRIYENIQKGDYTMEVRHRRGGNREGANQGGASDIIDDDDDNDDNDADGGAAGGAPRGLPFPRKLVLRSEVSAAAGRVVHAARAERYRQKAMLRRRAEAESQIAVDRSTESVLSEMIEEQEANLFKLRNRRVRIRRRISERQEALAALLGEQHGGGGEEGKGK